jgi:hypothetical protein
LPDLSKVLGPGWLKATEGSIGELGLAVLTGSRQTIEVPWALLPNRWTNGAGPLAMAGTEDPGSGRSYRANPNPAGQC